MASDPLAKHYESLTAPERFALLVEAMARRDDREADRLQDTCPRFTYRSEDTEFRERVRRAYMITVTACLNMREGLARIWMAEAIREASDHFAGPVAMATQVAFLYGREYGKWEAGAIDTVDLPDPERLTADVKASPDLKRQLAELQEVAGEVMSKVADAVHEVTGIAHAADVLAQWEGFGRFCRDELGVEPSVLAAAFGSRGDPAAEVRRAYPAAAAGEDDIARWAVKWTGSWRRRFGG